MYAAAILSTTSPRRLREASASSKVRVTALGRERFAAAMPHWEAAQRRIDALVPVRELQALARKLAVQASAGAS